MTDGLAENLEAGAGRGLARRTPLAAEHERLGARMVDFAGWWMPVQYEGVKEEHLHVRSRVGLFDVSHMGELRFRGPAALKALQWMTTNDVARLGPGEAQYSLIGNERGGIVDDIIIYCLVKDQDYLVCVNAANTAKDLAWFKAHNLGAEIVDESEKWAQIAVQGPRALSLVSQVLGHQATFDLKTFCFARVDYRKLNRNESEGEKLIVARTGYTGEDGAEIFVPRAAAVGLWRDLLNVEGELQAKPIGLGARDTLRTEMKYSLYGNEIDDTTNPYAAQLGWVVKPEAKEFLGRALMLEQKALGIKQKLIGLKLLDKGIARAGYVVCDVEGKKIGQVTSGTLSPSLGEAIAIAYLDSQLCAVNSEVFVDIRGRKSRARVVRTPFVNA